MLADPDVDADMRRVLAASNLPPAPTPAASAAAPDLTAPLDKLQQWLRS